MRNRNYREKEEFKFNREQRRTFKNPWFWVAVAALIIVPFTAFAWISNDTYNNFMARQGCRVVNTFDNGTKVWECPKENK